MHLIVVWPKDRGSEAEAITAPHLRMLIPDIESLEVSQEGQDQAGRVANHWYPTDQKQMGYPAFILAEDGVALYRTQDPGSLVDVLAIKDIIKAKSEE